MKESKSDGSRVRGAYAIVKFHSLLNQLSSLSLLELPLGYPASVPEFPLDPDFPGMVNVLYYMLQYRYRTILLFFKLSFNIDEAAEAKIYVDGSFYGHFEYIEEDSTLRVVAFD